MVRAASAHRRVVSYRPLDLEYSRCELWHSFMLVGLQHTLTAQNLEQWTWQGDGNKHS